MSVYTLTLIIGIVMLLTAIMIFIRPNAYADIIDEFTSSKIFPLYSGYLALVIGLLILTQFNHWTTPSEILVATVGWLSLAKGVFLLLFPGLFQAVAKVFKQRIFIYTSAAIVFVIGLFATWLVL